MSPLDMRNVCDDLAHARLKARCVLLAIKGTEMGEQYRDALELVLHSVVDEVDDVVFQLRAHAKEMQA